MVGRYESTLTEAFLKSRLSEGATIAEIASDAGCSATTVQDYMARYRLSARRRRSHIPPDDDELRTAHRDGGIVAIVERYGVSPSLARRWLLAAGVELDGARRGAPTKRLDIDEMRQRYETGESLAAIGADAGVDASTVHRRLKAAGVQMRPRGPKSSI